MHQTSVRYVALQKTSSKLSRLDLAWRSKDVINNVFCLKTSELLQRDDGVCVEMAREEKPLRRANLSLLALISFVASFMIARAFTTISPDVVLVGNGFHIHHFWYGIIMLAIGGWLGISYNDERIDRLAAVVYGAGGGLIGDEVGLLLTFGNYWTGITYTIIVVFLAFVSTFILFKRYSRAILAEVEGLTRSKASFYFGIILAGVSIAFITTSNFFVASISAVTAIIVCIIIIAYVAQRIGKRH